MPHFYGSSLKKLLRTKTSSQTALCHKTLQMLLKMKKSENYPLFISDDLWMEWNLFFYFHVSVRCLSFQLIANRFLYGSDGVGFGIGTGF